MIEAYIMIGLAYAVRGAWAINKTKKPTRTRTDIIGELLAVIFIAVVWPGHIINFIYHHTIKR